MTSLLKPRKRSNRKAALKAIFHDREAYKIIDESLKLDRNFVVEAVKINGSVFKFVNSDFKKDKEIIKLSLKTDISQFKYIDDDLKYDEDFIFELIEMDYFIYRYIDREKFKKDQNFMLKALDVNPEIGYLFCGEDFHDKEVILKAKNKYFHGMIPEKLRSDLDFMLEMIKFNKHFITKIDFSNVEMVSDLIERLISE